MEGTAGITWSATQRLSQFNLDLAGLRARSVTVDGRATTWRRSPRRHRRIGC